MKAFLKNYRQAPRKVRIVANAVRGKNAKDADVQLSMMSQKSAPVLRKLIASAVANARATRPSLKAEDLVVHSITVDKGITFVRFMPRAFGRATPINHECAHVRVALAEAGATQEHVAETAKKGTKNR